MIEKNELLNNKNILVNSVILIAIEIIQFEMHFDEFSLSQKILIFHENIILLIKLIISRCKENKCYIVLFKYLKNSNFIGNSLSFYDGIVKS